MATFDELTPEEKKSFIQFAKTVNKPPEHYNEIVNSGMCNSIIEGYILIALDQLDLINDDNRDNIAKIHWIFDEFSAEEARERYKKGV